IWFVIKYRGRPGRKGHYTHGSAKAEVIWTAIPAVTVVALGLVSNHYWKEIKGRDSIPADAYPIGIHAKQFEWQVTYPGPDGELGCAELCGMGHYRMRARVFIHTPAEFTAWMQQQIQGGATS